MTSNNAHAAPSIGAMPTPQEGFQFLEGNWRVSNRKLKDTFSGRDEWNEFESRARFITLLDGLVSVEELRDAKGQPFGSAMRTFDREKRTWSDAWVSARDGVLNLPQHGKFIGDRAEFISHDTYNDKPIQWRGMWQRVTKDRVIWEQAFSVDDGKSWTLEWHMQFDRVTDK